MAERLSGDGKAAVIARFAANISHELANPLLGLKYLFDNFAERRGGFSASDQELLSLGRREVELISDTIVRLRALYQPLTAPRSRRDLHELVEASLAGLADARAARGIRLVCELWPDRLEASVVTEKIDFVIGQLVENAIEAMPDGGVLTVRSAIKDDRALISIGDTGNGLSWRDEQRLFEPFFSTKEDAAENGAAHGTQKKIHRGFGLAVSQHIVIEHRGALYCRRNEEGGCIFTMALPQSSRQNDSYRGVGQPPAEFSRIMPG